MGDEPEDTAGQRAADGGDGKALRSEVPFGHRTDPAAHAKREHHKRQEAQLPELDLPVAQPVAEHHADVRHRAGNVRGADDEAAIAAGRGVLHTAGQGDDGEAQPLLGHQGRRGEHEQRAFGHERDPVAAAGDELPRADDDSRQGRTDEKSEHDAQRGPGVGELSGREIAAEVRDGTGHVTDGCVEKTERDGVDVAGGAGQGHRTGQKVADFAVGFLPVNGQRMRIGHVRIGARSESHRMDD